MILTLCKLIWMLIKILIHDVFLHVDRLETCLMADEDRHDMEQRVQCAECLQSVRLYEIVNSPVFGAGNTYVCWQCIWRLNL